MVFAVGTRVGPYEILAPLGAGGMGTVWKARDTRLDRIVALKSIREAHRHRFEHEARAIAALNHPHICQIHDVGDGYLVLEFVEGEALLGPMPVDGAVRLGIQIASAVEAAHDRGILHRDLKPSNIMVTATGDAKLLDFGLAKLLDYDADATTTVDGALVGTVAYMSPEQARGKPLDVRSDVFSFGAVVYEMLAGRRPFEGKNAVETLSAVLDDDPAPIDAPPALARIVTRCLRKQPSDRFQSMRDVRIALEQLATEAAPNDASIAVLPFANLSGDKENEYFGDGLAEEIINNLAKIPDLKVTARTSAFSFRGKDQPITTIARTLGVRTVLEGSIRRSGNRVRVMAQLINAADGFHLWSDRYDREMTDAFAIQDEIAEAIAGTLHRRLAPTAPLRPYTPNPAAYDAYLRARYHRAQHQPEAAARSRELIDQAIALDPRFALARRERSAYYQFQTLMGLMPAHEAMPLVRAAALDALAIDSSLPEAHASLGVVAGLYDYDWAEQERQFSLALARMPVVAEVRAMYGTFCLYATGRAADGVKELIRALEDDPLNLLYRVQLAMCLDASGDVDGAKKELEQVLSLNEHYFPATEWLALHYAFRGQIDDAVVYSERTLANIGQRVRFVGLLAGTLERSGQIDRARRLVDTLGDGVAYGAPIEFMFLSLLRSDIDAAAKWAERAVAQRDPYLPVLLRSQVGQRLRGSAAWPALAKLMNFSESR